MDFLFFNSWLLRLMMFEEHLWKAKQDQSNWLHMHCHGSFEWIAKVTLQRILQPGIPLFIFSHCIRKNNKTIYQITANFRQRPPLEILSFRRASKVDFSVLKYSCTNPFILLCPIAQFALNLIYSLYLDRQTRPHVIFRRAWSCTLSFKVNGRPQLSQCTNACCLHLKPF